MSSEKTNVKENTNNYELIFILKPDLTEEALAAAVANIKNTIVAQGGEITEEQNWGKKRLAYPIKHTGEGFYTLLKYQAKPGSNRGLESGLKISENVLRHLLIKVD